MLLGGSGSEAAASSSEAAPSRVLLADTPPTLELMAEKADSGSGLPTLSEAKPLTSTAGHHVKKLARKPTPMEVT